MTQQEAIDWTVRLARMSVHDQNLASDLVQETWLIALERFGFDCVPSNQWLARTLKSLEFRRRRSSKRRKEREGIAAKSDSPSLESDALEWLDAQWLLAKGVLHLEESERIAILLHFQEGCSMSEIARRLGCGKSTVSDRVQRGLANLRARFRSVDDGGFQDGSEP